MQQMRDNITLDECRIGLKSLDVNVELNTNEQTKLDELDYSNYINLFSWRYGVGYAPGFLAYGWWGW